LRHSIAAIPEFVYRRVILRGTWDHAHSVLLGPRVLDGTNGFHLITPLVRTNGSTILVDRGFISELAAVKKKYPTPSEDVEVHGMLRESQARNNFTPDNNPAKGEWYWADVAAMAEYAGGESSNVQPVLVEEIFGGFSCSSSVG
jgi:surfeit locus 1 family protein